MKKHLFIPPHGGDVLAASQHYGVALADWLDLSTGINPDPYPIPRISSQYFYNLPFSTSNILHSAAKDYYQVEQLAVAAGSQQFIQLIPRVRAIEFGPCTVAIPAVGYQEHAKQWQRCGHEIIWYDGWQPQKLTEKITAGEVDCAVVINPNNPTGAEVSIARLKQWQQRLASQQGWLVIDEAFIDVEPDKSFSTHSHLPGVIVLRSVGKFFGLAGIRIGFALAESELLSLIAAHACLWQQSGVSEFVAAQALADQSWQQHTRNQLCVNSHWLAELLRRWIPANLIIETPFFISLRINKNAGELIYQRLGQAGILIRLWPLEGSDEVLLRFGLVTNDDRYREKLRQCLKRVSSVAPGDGE